MISRNNTVRYVMQSHSFNFIFCYLFYSIAVKFYSLDFKRQVSYIMLQMFQTVIVNARHVKRGG